jgi:hypothetical protein
MMLELSFIRDLVTIFGVIAGFSYYVLTVRASQRNQELVLKAQQQALETRQAQLFMEMYNNWKDIDRSIIENEVINGEYEDPRDWFEKYGSDPMNRIKLGNSASFYEGLGVLVNRGFLNPVLVDDLISGNIVTYWEETGPLWNAVREQYDYHQVAQWVEFLYNEVKEIMLSEHPELRDKTTGVRKIHKGKQN